MPGALSKEGGFCPRLMLLPFLKLFQNLRTLMTPYKVTFESPLELSAQGESSQLTD